MNEQASDKRRQFVLEVPFHRRVTRRGGELTGEARRRQSILLLPIKIFAKFQVITLGGLQNIFFNQTSCFFFRDNSAVVYKMAEEKPRANWWEVREPIM